MIPTPEPRIAAFESMAYGMFLHYGLYSLLGTGEWSMSRQHISRSDYARLADDFTAEHFDGRALARTAAAAGMKYICLTTRHHDGFSLYDTRGLNDFDAPHSAAGRDLVADFVDGCRAQGIVPFLYHTTLDWHRPEFDTDFNAYLQYLRDSVEILCTQYGPLGGLWFDGNWSRPEADWQLDALYGMIRRHQGDAMIIDNSGMGARGTIGHGMIDSVTYERGAPRPMDRRGMSKYIACEMCQTMNQHWGMGKDDFHYLSPGDIIEQLCQCRGAGANFLLNVGPEPDGALPDYERAALCRAGQWVHRFASIIREGRPSRMSAAAGDVLLDMPDGSSVLLAGKLAIDGSAHVVLGCSMRSSVTLFGAEKALSAARWLDNNEPLSFCQNRDTGMITIALTGYPYGTDLVMRPMELTFA